MSTLIRTVGAPLTDKGPAAPNALPTLLTLVTAVGRESGRTTLDESPTLAATVEPAGFTGEPTVVSKVYTAFWRSVRVVTDFLGVDDIGTPIAKLLRSDTPPGFVTRGLDVQRREFEGMPVWILKSPESTSEKYVVAVHGGAFVTGPDVLFEWPTYAGMARETGATVIVPIYPLAPQGTAATVVPVVANLISAQIGQHGAENVSVFGDSAGGTLVFTAVQELVRRGDPVPSHMVLISPALDLTFSNPAIQSVRDPVLNATILRNGVLWAGDLELTDPLVSPLFGSLAGLPPTAVYSGNQDLASPDVLVLQDKALATPGADFTFVLRDGELHVWPFAWFLPEARAVRPDIYRQLGL